jgi:hypothetical protein
MIKKLLPLIILICAIYATNKIPAFTMSEVPKSQPTQTELFMDRVASIESDGNYKVVNQYGMMGKYQFSPSTVRALGFRMTPQQFLQNEDIQDTVMLAYMKANYRELKNLIDRYDGKTKHGIKITRAGILAGAHFAGSGGVVAYLTSNDKHGIIDGNGTSIRKYMSSFSNFKLPPLSL